MDNNSSRALAKNKYGASDIVEFSQGASLCTAYVAAWLRKRSRGKDFWGDKRFGREDGGTRRYGHEGAAVTKAKAQMPDFLKDPKLEVAYIQAGSKGLNHGLAHVLGYGGLVSGQNGESSLKAAFEEVATAKMLASLSVSIERAALDVLPSHAIGLDCSGAGSVYFDPNLGQLTFHAIDELCDWWFECFGDRKNTGASTNSAFQRMIDSRFRIEFYERPLG